MLQVKATVWNQIAETQELATEWAEQMFPLPPEDLLDAIKAEETRLAETYNISRDLAQAYLRVMPLLWETEAIAAHVERHPELESALPNVETVNEAVRIASLDFSLTTAQQDRLRQLLQTPPTP